MPVKAGDLVLLDSRILHAADRNRTGVRRTLVLAWHSRPEDTVPAFWQDEIPAEIAGRDPQASYEGSRIPGKYLRAGSNGC